MGPTVRERIRIRRIWKNNYTKMFTRGAYSKDEIQSAVHMPVYSLALANNPTWLNISDSHPTPSIFLDASANSADSGERSDEMKNAINKFIKFVTIEHSMDVLWMVNAGMNSERRICMIITTNHGIESRILNTVVHSVPYLSVRYPLSGEAVHAAEYLENFHVYVCVNIKLTKRS